MSGMDPARARYGAKEIHQAVITVSCDVDNQLVESRKAGDNGGGDKTDRFPLGDVGKAFEVKDGELVMIQKRDIHSTLGSTNSIMGITSLNGAFFPPGRPEEALEDLIPIGLAYNEANRMQDNDSRNGKYQKFSVQTGGSANITSETRAFPTGAAVRWEPVPRNTSMYEDNVQKWTMQPVPELDGKPFAMRAKGKLAQYVKNRDPNAPILNKSEMALFDHMADLLAVGIVLGYHINGNTNDVEDLFARMFPSAPGKFQGEKNLATLFGKNLSSQADRTQSKMERQFLMSFLFPMLDENTASNSLLLPTTGGNPQLIRLLHQAQIGTVERVLESFADSVRTDNKTQLGHVIKGCDAGTYGTIMY